MTLFRARRRDEQAELAALADRSLAPDRRAALAARIEASPELAEELRVQQRAVALTRSAAAGVEAPAALRARVGAQRRLRRGPVRGRLVIAGAAAAAAAVLAVGFAVSRSGSSSTRFTAALAPTVLVPGARGEATLTRTSSGWRVVLETSGLPPRHRGRFYEAWLRNSAGVLVPIGTFNEGGYVTLWAGVSPGRFTTVTVTREQAGGRHVASGQQVLIGTVTSG
jgi:hypothetical protein